MVTTQRSSRTDQQFQESLAFGKMAETAIARWLRSKGYTTLPVYAIEEDTGKGPRVWTPNDRLVAPDILAWGYGKARWIEAKRKTVFTWYRKKQRWETGIDAHHFDQYIRIADESPFPVHLLFLHTDDRCSGRSEPWPCPVGLFSQNIRVLDTVKRYDSRHGWHGMVYFGHVDLKLLAPLETVLRLE